MTEYATKAVEALDGMTPTRPEVKTQVAMSGITAVTYALLDLAAAIREHGAR